MMKYDDFLQLLFVDLNGRHVVFLLLSPLFMGIAIFPIENWKRSDKKSAGSNIFVEIIFKALLIYFNADLFFQ